MDSPPSLCEPCFVRASHASLKKKKKTGLMQCSQADITWSLQQMWTNRKRLLTSDARIKSLEWTAGKDSRGGQIPWGLAMYLIFH